MFNFLTHFRKVCWYLINKRGNTCPCEKQPYQEIWGLDYFQCLHISQIKQLNIEIFTVQIKMHFLIIIRFEIMQALRPGWMKTFWEGHKWSSDRSSGKYHYTLSELTPPSNGYPLPHVVCINLLGIYRLELSVIRVGHQSN